MTLYGSQTQFSLREIKYLLYHPFHLYFKEYSLEIARFNLKFLENILSLEKAICVKDRVTKYLYEFTLFPRRNEERRFRWICRLNS